MASIWTRKPESVSWIDAAALPSSAEAAAGVLRQLNVTSGETLLLFGGGGSVGIIATQLAVARGVTVISAAGEHDGTLACELGATPVRYGAGLAGRVRALGAIDAVFDAAGQGVLADAIALAGGPERVITLPDPAAADFGVTLSQPTLPAIGRNLHAGFPALQWTVTGYTLTLASLSLLVGSLSDHWGRRRVFLAGLS